MTELPSRLERLEELWRSSGVPIGEHFAVGSDAGSIRERLDQESLPAPPEVVEWFEWHDGAGPARRQGSPLGPSGWSALSLEEALTERMARLEDAIDAAEGGDGQSASHWWEPSWLPLADNGGQGALAADLSQGELVAVRSVSWDDPEGFRMVRATSLRELVDIWIGVIEGGGWTWSPAARTWQGDFSSLPADINTRYLM